MNPRGLRGVGRGILALFLTMVASSAAVAQDSARPSVTLGPASEGAGGAELLLAGILNEGSFEDALDSGLPLRIRARLELWRDELFDDQEGVFEWRMNIVPDPLSRDLRVVGEGPPPMDALTPDLFGATDLLSRPVTIPLRPTRSGRFYYLGWVEVETLSLSDLEELQRWLRGELGTAVGAGEPVEAAVEDGFGRLLVRALGLPVRRVRVRSETFSHDGQPDSDRDRDR
jgi:hypothetical protein